jgi:hypothetical protein
MRLRAARPEPQPGLMLMIDADQSAVECYSVSMWVWLTTSAYFAVELSKRWPLALAIVVALPLASLAMQVPLYAMGTLVLPAVQALARPRAIGLAAVNSAFTIALQVIAASFYALEQTWVRFVAWQFLGILLLNAIAAAFVFLLRGPITRLEASYGVTPSSAD